MKMLFKKIALSIFLVAMVGCTGGGSSPTAPETPGPVTLSLSRETAHFILRFTESDADKMDAYAAALEGSFHRITRHLDQSGLPRITGRFYPDSASYAAATGWTSGGSVQGLTIFSVVAAPLQPSLPVHEFAHNVALHLDSHCDNNPTWLWEATAVWEAEELVEPSTLSCLTSGDFPTMSELNERGGNCDIYRVGYTIVEFIVERWSLSKYRDLIVSHGDTESVLGLSIEEFEAAWQEFVEDRYL